MYYADFSFHRLAISATHFLVVFHHFRICKMSLFKENIITELQKLYSLPRNLWVDNKSPALFLKNFFARVIYCPCAKYSLKGLK